MVRLLYIYIYIYEEIEEVFTFIFIFFKVSTVLTLHDLDAVHILFKKYNKSTF